jgi:type II secretory ATPase GspE/PulE/Tfp pilus assembly ATPase PilB-like protein
MTPETSFIHLITTAVQRKATDLHLRFEAGKGTLELRTSKGLIRLKEVYDPSLLEYIKYRANLDLLLGYVPQTGHTSVWIAHHPIHLRIAYLHSLTYDHLVIRIMNPPRYLKPQDLFTQEDVRWIMSCLNSNSGLVLIAGTTGSGKTTTLYTLLNQLTDRKIVTIEDPIESHIPALTQIQINPRQGLTFETALKQVLRHDPDVIVIGEIRDESEARTALRSAMTGHLVLSTIHARSAPQTIDRLVNLGLDRQEVLDSLILVIHQDLQEEPHGKKVHYELYPSLVSATPSSVSFGNSG